MYNMLILSKHKIYLNHHKLAKLLSHAQIIANNKALGIETGPNKDGSPNKINQLVYNITKCIVDGIKNDAVIQAAIPAGSIQIQGTGGNAGGPVTVTGMNIISSIAKGLMR